MQCVLTGRDSLALMGCAHHARRAKNRTMNAVGALTASTAPGLSAWMGFNAAGVKQVAFETRFNVQPLCVCI